MQWPLVFQKKPLEFVSAFAMILGGVYLSGTGAARPTFISTLRGAMLLQAGQLRR